MIKEIANRIAFMQSQFEIAKMYALYWQTMASTGAAKLRKTSQGREPNEEEKARGLSIGWTEHTDEEKTMNALNTMNIHILHMKELSEAIWELQRESP